MSRSSERSLRRLERTQDILLRRGEQLAAEIEAERAGIHSPNARIAARQEELAELRVGPVQRHLAIALTRKGRADLERARQLRAEIETLRERRFARLRRATNAAWKARRELDQDVRAHREDAFWAESESVGPSIRELSRSWAESHLAPVIDAREVARHASELRARGNALANLIGQREGDLDPAAARDDQDRAARRLLVQTAADLQAFERAAAHLHADLIATPALRDPTDSEDLAAALRTSSKAQLDIDRTRHALRQARAALVAKTLRLQALEEASNRRAEAMIQATFADVVATLRREAGR